MYEGADLQLETIKDIDIDKDDYIIDTALKGLSKAKHEDVDLTKDAIQDFQKLSIAKGLPTINLNRYRNDDFYKYGQLMDKDVPLF